MGTIPPLTSAACNINVSDEMTNSKNSFSHFNFTCTKFHSTVSAATSAYNIKCQYFYLSCTFVSFDGDKYECFLGNKIIIFKSDRRRTFPESSAQKLFIRN